MTDDAKPRRTRSRRGARTGASEAADAPVARTETVPTPTPAASAPERPVQETHLRQSDRRGESGATETKRSDGRPFGEGDIPAFLRRPVSLKG